MTESCDIEEVVSSFAEENRQEGLRVFVAGGNRPGNDPLYVEEAYNLGRQIIKLDFKLDFGLSNSGIMGAVARGVSIMTFIRTMMRLSGRLKMLYLPKRWRNANRNC